MNNNLCWRVDDAAEFIMTVYNPLQIHLRISKIELYNANGQKFITTTDNFILQPSVRTELSLKMRPREEQTIDVSHAIIYLFDSCFSTSVYFNSLGINQNNKLISVPKSVIYHQPPDLKKPYFNDIKAIKVEKRQCSLFISASIDSMDHNTISLSDGENFVMKIDPLPCSSFNDYELIELEILAVKKQFSLSLDMVDEAMLAFPTSIQIHSNKQFASYFRDQTSCRIDFVHKRENFGYVARLKYAQRADMRQIRTDSHLIKVKEESRVIVEKLDVVTFSERYLLEKETLVKQEQRPLMLKEGQFGSKECSKL